MAEEFKCPLLKEEEPKEEEIQVEPPKLNGFCDDAEMDILGLRFKGVRTYSIILLIILAYSYLSIVNNDAAGMRDLALMACGFLFGAKITSKK